MAEWVEQKYGGFWIRFLAYLIDSLIVGIGFVAIVMVLGMMGLELFSPELIFGVVAILYWAGMHASSRQATYGKALLGLRVTGTIGDRISIVKSLVRELAKILSTLTFCIGYILAGLTKRNQALHDFIASTTVARVEPGHVVAGVAVAIVALCAPVVVAMMFGMGVVAGALGGIAGAVLSDPQIMAQQTPPKPAAPAPKPAAPAPKAQVVQAPAAAPKPAPAAPVEPKVVAAAAPAPAPAKAVEAPPAKPIPTAAPAPAAPVVLAQATEPAKPAAPKESAKPIVVQSAEPKPARKPRAKPVAEPKPEALPKEAAAAPKPEPKPEPQPVVAEEAPAPLPVPSASGPGPKFNDLMTAVIYRDAKTVDELLGFGKWADKPDSRGLTPLMVAAMLGDAPIAESLLKAGANPNVPGPGGDTATSIARQRSDAALLGLLRQHGGR